MISESKIIEIYPKKFCFATVSQFTPDNAKGTLYITVDESEYPVINSYFGPPNISDIYKYCTSIQYLLNRTKKKIIHWSSYLDLKKYSNAVFLVGTFMVLVMKKNPDYVGDFVWRKIARGNMVPFRDTTDLPDEATLPVEYFYHALHIASELNWFSLNDFNYYHYDFLSSLQGGDMNWIVPDKILALSEPFLFVKDKSYYIQMFKKNKIKVLVRTNAASYNRNIFEKNGIQHFDLPYQDGGVPPPRLVARFLRICKCTPGRIAIHCRAGLGRTGTLVAAYIMNTYPQFSALDAVAWIRMCRPGSVIGLQQEYLRRNEEWIKSFSSGCPADEENDEMDENF